MFQQVDIGIPYWQEEWNVVEGNVCNYFHLTWKLTSHGRVTKVIQTTSWVFMCSLPWAQRKRWTLVASMRCVHTHQGILTIERCGNPSRIWNIVEKDGEDNWKVGKVGWAISQMLTLELKHDKIKKQWVSNTLSKNMLEGMMVQLFWDGILKLNHLLLDELFKGGANGITQAKPTYFLIVFQKKFLNYFWNFLRKK